jgi:hypothetical protein
VRAEVPEYDLALEGEFGRLITEGVRLALEQFVGLLGRDVPPPDLEIYAAMGREEHRQGRTLDALQSAYRVGARVSWRHVSEFGAEAGIPPEELYRLAEAIFAYIDRLAAESVAGFAAQETLREGAMQTRRHALVELVVRDPPADPEELTAAARAARWTPPPRLAVLACGEGDVVALARRLPSGAIAASTSPVGLVLVPDPDAPGADATLTAALRGRRGVLGPGVTLADAPRSARRALAAWDLHAAGRLGDEPLVRADDHLLALVLAGDAGLAEELADRELAPLDALTPAGRARAVETLRAWLDAHGDVALSAESLHVHAQTVRYRLARVREALGDAALDDPDRRLALTLALRVRPRP